MKKIILSFVFLIVLFTSALAQSLPDPEATPEPIFEISIFTEIKDVLVNILNVLTNSIAPSLDEIVTKNETIVINVEPNITLPEHECSSEIYIEEVIPFVFNNRYYFNLLGNKPHASFSITKIDALFHFRGPLTIQINGITCYENQGGGDADLQQDWTQCSNAFVSGVRNIANMGEAPVGSGGLRFNRLIIEYSITPANC